MEIGGERAAGTYQIEILLCQPSWDGAWAEVCKTKARHEFFWESSAHWKF
jgi:hypothetical protein